MPAIGGAVVRICLSCHSPDEALALALKQAFETSYADAEVPFARRSLRVGNFFVPPICPSPDEADAFLLLLGEPAGRRKLLEFFETFDRHVTDDGFPPLPLIFADKAQRRINSGRSARGLNIAPNTALIRKKRLGAGSSENDFRTRGNRQSPQKSYLHTTSKTHGRTAWHI